MIYLIFRIKPHLKKSNISWEFFRRSVYYSSIIMFIVSSYFVFKYLVIDRFEFNKNTSEIQQIWEDSNNSDNEKKPEDDITLKNFDKIIGINPDIKGWIKIDGTVIDYPVLQSSKQDPSFYLYRNYKKGKDKNGSIFISSDISQLERDTKNIVLHGHNMNSGAMFASLLKYADINFYKAHPLIKFDTIFETGLWKVFAVIRTNSDPNQGEVFYDYLSPFFASKREFLKLIYNLKLRSILKIPVEVLESDKILTMSTCSYEMKGFRTVVFARKIRRGEDELVDLDNVKVNNNPMMPNGWYESRKMKIPRFETFEEYEKHKSRN